VRRKWSGLCGAPRSTPPDVATSAVEEGLSSSSSTTASVARGLGDPGGHGPVAQRFQVPCPPRCPSHLWPVIPPQQQYRRRRSVPSSAFMAASYSAVPPVGARTPARRNYKQNRGRGCGTCQNPGRRQQVSWVSSLPICGGGNAWGGLHLLSPAAGAATIGRPRRRTSTCGWGRAVTPAESKCQVQHLIASPGPPAPDRSRPSAIPGCCKMRF